MNAAPRFPQMGISDAILDLVSSGTTLRENNLKEIEGGIVLQSQVKTLTPFPFQKPILRSA